MIATVMLDALRAELETDASVSRSIGISRQAVSSIRRGVPMSEATALACAKRLEMDAGIVLALLRADYAETEAVRETWLEVARRLLPPGITDGTPGPLSQDDIIQIIVGRLLKKRRRYWVEAIDKLFYINQSQDCPKGCRNDAVTLSHFLSPLAEMPIAPHRPTVTLTEILAWCIAVPKPPIRPEDSRRLRYYVKYWSVPDKIHASRKRGELDQTIGHIYLTPRDLAAGYHSLAGLYEGPFSPMPPDAPPNTTPPTR